ncbi:MAG: hypothetical protein KatS3mg118_2980 [Paracoccaceae bacterium]|nr:MAG: DUF3830 family protein [Alphaproteobacteria bacterium]GIX15021.1 MAG: hypothetical protein KatS3mg118_2980 [Paracoccaceae bacterium]
MAEGFYIEFTALGRRWPIAPYSELAPVTCRTLWNALERPADLTAFHAMFAGPEIMMGLPESAQTFDPASIPAENQTCFPAPGECLWFYQGRNMMKGLPDELWEIGIFYDSGGRTFGPLGWTPVNIFGKIAEDLDGFAAACRAIRVEGAKAVTFGRRG